MKRCLSCSNDIELGRSSVLPDTTICSLCARNVNIPRVRGAMIYDHKTSPTICIMDAGYFDTNWKKYNPSFGRGSGVHKMSPRTAGTT